MSLDFLRDRRPLSLPDRHPPVLLVVIDTEEEFDWEAPEPFSRANTSVEAMRHIGRAQEVFDEYGVRPVYVVDHPVATQEAGNRLLREYAADGRATIGAHLHPWVSPPLEEEVTARNSYPGNLPPELEERKLRALTEAIERHFGQRPVCYKAGRYGFGSATAETLERLGYRVDLSPLSRFDLGEDGGPDWTEVPPTPCALGSRGELVCLPMTGDFVGWARGLAPRLYRLATGPLAGLRAPGILSRLGALERLMLSPEGFSLAHMKRLTRSLLARDERVLTLAFHSPSMAPGHTPYVRSEADLKAFLSICRQYLDFFLGELGGATMGPLELRELLLDPDAAQYPHLDP